MWCRKLVSVIPYLIWYNIILQDFGSGKPLAGHNIRLARKKDFPFIAGIIKRSRVFNVQTDTICTASLISDKDVLTAEHCVDEEIPNGLTIIVGSVDLLSHLKYYPSWWITFVQWARIKNISIKYILNDIAIIRLTSAVTNGTPAAKFSFLPYNDLVGKQVVTVGWGEINNGSRPRIAHTANLKIIKYSDCLERIGDLDGRSFIMDKNLVCTSAKDFVTLMQGDSGGPLLYQNKIVGVNIGTCPLPQQHFHPDKVNIHVNLKFYEYYVKRILKMF